MPSTASPRFLGTIWLLGVAACASAPASVAPSEVRLSEVLVAPVATASGTVDQACAPACMPNTDVPDTEDNRAIVSFCELYRHAMEQADAPALLRLASPKYLDDGGTSDPADDVDRAALDDFVRNKFGDAKNVRLEVRYRTIRVDHSRIVVEYTSAWSFRVGDGAWKRGVDDSTLVLEKTADSFQILSGM